MLEKGASKRSLCNRGDLSGASRRAGALGWSARYRLGIKVPYRALWLWTKQSCSPLSCRHKVSIFKSSLLLLLLWTTVLVLTLNCNTSYCVYTVYIHMHLHSQFLAETFRHSWKTQTATFTVLWRKFVDVTLLNYLFGVIPLKPIKIINLCIIYELYTKLGRWRRY